MIILCKNQMVFFTCSCCSVVIIPFIHHTCNKRKKNLLICRDNSRSDNSPSTSSPTPPEKKSSTRTKTKQKKNRQINVSENITTIKSKKQRMKM